MQVESSLLVGQRLLIPQEDHCSGYRALALSQYPLTTLYSPSLKLMPILVSVLSELLIHISTEHSIISFYAFFELHYWT